MNKKIKAALYTLLIFIAMIGLCLLMVMLPDWLSLTISIVMWVYGAVYIFNIIFSKL